MNTGEVWVALFVIAIPMLTICTVLLRWMRLKERRIEIEANSAAERAAQYAASNAELEARVRILEKIVTDGGIHTAAQIEALRDEPRAIAETKQ